MIFLKIHSLGVKSYTLLLETYDFTPYDFTLYDFTPYDFTPTDIFFFDVKTMHEVHFQSIFFRSHILCKGLKSLLNPLPKSSGHFHGDDTLFNSAKKFHRTLKKSFFLPCKQTSDDPGTQNGDSVNIDHLLLPYQWRHDTAASNFFTATVRVHPVYDFTPYHPTESCWYFWTC